MVYIVFFDGVCNLCNNSVDFIIKRDVGRKFRYTSLQSEFANKVLKEHGVDTSTMQTIMLLKEGELFYRSDAVLEIARELPAPWPVFYIFKIVPRFIRDACYKLISQNRYSWFGQRDTCRIPTAEERELFLEDGVLPSAENAKLQPPNIKKATSSN